MICALCSLCRYKYMPFFVFLGSNSRYSNYIPDIDIATSSHIMQNPSVVLYGTKNAKIEDTAMPEVVNVHDVIVRINYVGVCGSDVRPPTPLPESSHSHQDGWSCDKID